MSDAPTFADTLRAKVQTYEENFTKSIEEFLKTYPFPDPLIKDEVWQNFADTLAYIAEFGFLNCDVEFTNDGKLSITPLAHENTRNPNMMLDWYKKHNGKTLGLTFLCIDTWTKSIPAEFRKGSVFDFVWRDLVARYRLLFMSQDEVSKHMSGVEVYKKDILYKLVYNWAKSE